jgi:hypothetical protein
MDNALGPIIRNSSALAGIATDNTNAAVVAINLPIFLIINPPVCFLRGRPAALCPVENLSDESSASPSVWQE